jgi:hypothetical protein
VDPGRARGDRGKDHVRGRQREVIGVVFTDPDEIDPDLVGEDTLFDKVADRLCMGERAVVVVVGDVAEGVEPEGEWEWSSRVCGHAVSLLRLSIRGRGVGGF